ncbi:uncharacterized protein LOC134776845 [Penaeus indicus]|uniref:uncharacterized protein LOC134776845 n=1 Tax=Penaeus indicus TaxID=29960 RepID=UPI00300CF833
MVQSTKQGNGTMKAARGRCLRMSGVWVPPVAISGTEVKFTCHYETSPSLNDTLYSLKWYRGHDQFYEYIPRNIPPMKVYESAHVHVDSSIHFIQLSPLPQKSQSDANTVVLKGVTRETSGSFQCEVVGDKPLFETDNYTKNMTVVDIPPWGPRLTHRPLSSKVGVQDIIQARCEVGPSDPPTEITWTINRAPAPPYARVKTYRNENRVHVSDLHIQVTEDLFYKGELVVACGAKLLSAFDKTANVTFVDVNAPEPAGYGWLSAGILITDLILFSQKL